MEGISLSWILRIQELEVKQIVGRQVQPANTTLWHTCLQIILRSKHQELQAQAEKYSTAEVLLGQASDQQVTVSVTSIM